MDLWDDGSVATSSITNVNRWTQKEEYQKQIRFTRHVYTASLSISDDPTNRIWSSNQYPVFWLCLGYSQFSDVYLCQTRVVITKLVEDVTSVKACRMIPVHMAKFNHHDRAGWVLLNWPMLGQLCAFIGEPSLSWVSHKNREYWLCRYPFYKPILESYSTIANLPAHPTTFLSPLKVSTYVWIIDYALFFLEDTIIFHTRQSQFPAPNERWLGTNTRFTQPSWILLVNLKIGCFPNLL